MLKNHKHFCFFIKMFFSTLFKRNKRSSPSALTNKLKFLGVDMHNHLLPGIDDGCETVEDSIYLMEGLQELGFQKMIFTPHVMEGIYPNNVRTITEAKYKLSNEIMKHPFLNTISLETSAEYMIDGGFPKLLKSNQLSPIRDKYVLIEMSYMSESRNLFQAIFEIQSQGYIPVLAHPERYNYYQNDREKFKKIKDAGCLLQLNLLSISRYYGSEIRESATELIKMGMYDFVGTDLHHAKHLEALCNLVVKYPVEKILSKCNIKNISLLE